MIAGAVGVDAMLVGFDSGLMSVQPVQHINGFILGGAHRRDVEVTALVRDPGIELAPGVAAVMSVDVATLGARPVPRKNWPFEDDVVPLPQSLAKGCAKWASMTVNRHPKGTPYWSAPLGVDRIKLPI